MKDKTYLRQVLTKLLEDGEWSGLILERIQHSGDKHDRAVWEMTREFYIEKAYRKLAKRLGVNE